MMLSLVSIALWLAASFQLVIPSEYVWHVPYCVHHGGISSFAIQGGRRREFVCKDNLNVIYGEEIDATHYGD